MQTRLRYPWRPMLAAVAVLTLLASFSAQSQNGQTRRLVAAPAIAQPGDTAHVLFTNTGRRPLRVIPRLVDADGNVIAAGDLTVLGPGTTGTFSVLFEGPGPSTFVTVLGLQSAQGGMSGIRASLQVIDFQGRTQIFTDGFESGDLSA